MERDHNGYNNCETFSQFARIHTSSLNKIEKTLIIRITKFHNGDDVMRLQQSYGQIKRGQLLLIRNIIFYKKQYQQMYNVKKRSVCMVYCKLLS